MNMFISPKKNKTPKASEPPFSDLNRLKELIGEREEKLLEPFEHYN